MQFDKPPFREQDYRAALDLGRRLAYFVDEERPSGAVEQSLLLDEVHDLLRTHTAFRYDTTRHQCVLAEAVLACYMGLRDGLADPSRLTQDVIELPLVTPPNANGAVVSRKARHISAEAFVNCAPHPNESLGDISREHQLWLDDKAVREYDRSVSDRWSARSRRMARERELREPEESLSLPFSGHRQAAPGF